MQWLQYRIIRSKTYATVEGSPARKKLSPVLYKHVKDMAKTQLPPFRTIMVLEDALYLKDKPLARKLYKGLDKEAAFENPEVYAQMGRVALALGDYQQSGEFYFKAQAQVGARDKKRKYFIAGLKSLQQGNLLNKAIKEAESRVGDLINDQDTLFFLTKLALAANKPALAERYIKQAIKRVKAQ